MGHPAHTAAKAALLSSLIPAPKQAAEKLECSIIFEGARLQPRRNGPLFSISRAGFSPRGIC
ncbi:MAG: hypothetical protein ABSD88_18490, partial [Candidatus Korobacteraceae bacterium]